MWDFNGTIFDDARAGIDAVNKMLDNFRDNHLMGMEERLKQTKDMSDKQKKRL